ncbi:MAG TPA: hypothetical protein VJ552_02440 [Sediminibacterium sp.]|nr:hypothetical protein [Sediminibacterium sp.]
MLIMYFFAAIIVLVFVLAVQLIRMDIYALGIRKDNILNQATIKEDTDWEFIKGLY